MSISDADIRAAFDSFDKDGNGSIDKDEIAKVCEELGVDASGSEIADLLKEADENGDGKISFEEFKNAVNA